MNREQAELMRIATSISDGEAVDWKGLESQVADEQAYRILKQLEVLASVARVHRGASHSEEDAALNSRGRSESDVLEPEVQLGNTAFEVAGPTFDTTPSSSELPARQWGHLVLRERVGSGAFGSVYRAWDPTVEREVALKLLKPTGLELRNPGSDVERAAELREARILASIRHPNIVTVYGAEEHDGKPGLWMEFIRGRTLERILDEHGPFGGREAALVCLDLCRALAAVHGARLVHRDIKSHNVMREDGGRIVLMDFGVGGRVRDHQTDGSFTIAGTPQYIAPEVLAGRGARPQSDIYGLGVLLYHLVTGGYPTSADSLTELGHADPQAKPRLLRDARPDLPEPFVRIVEKALSLDPAQRYPSAGEMELALTSALGLVAEPPTHMSPLVSEPMLATAPTRRIRHAALLSAAVVAALVIGSVWLRGRHDRQTGTEAAKDQASHDLAATATPRTRLDEPAAAGTSIAVKPSPGKPAAESTMAYTVEASFQRRHGNSVEPLTSGARVAPGDHLSLEISATVPVFVYIIDEDERGEAWLLFPLPGLELANPLPASRQLRLPGKLVGKPFDWTVTSAGGREHLLIVASPTRLAEFEAEMLALPQAGAQGPLHLSEQAKKHLRGIGGLEQESTNGGTAASSHLFEMAARLASRSEQVHGVWVRRVEFENPGP